MKVRKEQDTMGSVEVPEEKYWGAQTQRSLLNFKIGHQKFSRSVIKAMGIVKKACVLTNKDLGKISAEKTDLIVKACDQVISGSLDDNFPLVVWQTGSGTQSNMNANEVIANKAIEIAGGIIGSKDPIHPNDDVNKSQSSNDTFPTFMHLAAVFDINEQLLPSLDKLHQELLRKSKEFKDTIKIGRTHMMDATPLSVGQELSGFCAQVEFAKKTIVSATESLSELALGGTAVGTGINSHPEFAKRAAQKISDLSGYKFVSAENKFAALAAHDQMVSLSGALRVLAVACMKIANDIRLLASGPRCGIGELVLPANEPGSSIMPGKVNPTQCEALTMVAAQVMGNDTTVGIAGSNGHFQLNVFKPVILHNILESIELLSQGCLSFTENCVVGLQVNNKKIQTNLENSLMLVTALNQVIGYDKAAKIAKKAWQEDKTLREVSVELGFLSEQDFDKYVNPKKMISP